MKKIQLMKKSSLVLFGLLGPAGCKRMRPQTPLTYGGTESEDLPEKGGSTGLPFLVRASSQDETYGFTANNPVRVGGGREAGARNQQRYLTSCSALAANRLAASTKSAAAP